MPWLLKLCQVCVTAQHDALQSKAAYLAGLLQDCPQQMEVVGSGCHKSQVPCTGTHVLIRPLLLGTSVQDCIL